MSSEKTKASKVVKKEDTDEMKRIKAKIENMKALGLLVKEVIETGIPRQRGAKTKPTTEHPGVKAAIMIIKGLNSANCKIEFYLKPYATIFAENRRDIFASATELYWMTPIVVKAHLGDPKHHAYLHLSMAMNSAMKMRKTIDEKKYNNPNDKEEALGDYKYGYVDLLHYRFLAVVIDALGEDHKDVTRLQGLLEKFKALTHLGAESSDDEASDDEKPSIGKTISKLAGEKHSTKGIEKAVNSMVSNTDVFENVKNIVKDMGATEGNPLENTELLVKTVTSMAPIFTGMFEGMSQSQNGKDSSESGSESAEESSE